MRTVSLCRHCRAAVAPSLARSVARLATVTVTPGRACSSSSVPTTSGSNQPPLRDERAQEPFSLIDVMGSGVDVTSVLDAHGDESDVSRGGKDGGGFHLPSYSSPRTAAMGKPSSKRQWSSSNAASKAEAVHSGDSPGTPKRAAHGTAESIRRTVQEVVLRPLGAEDAESRKADVPPAGEGKTSNGAAEKATHASSSEAPSVSTNPLTVHIADKFGMPAELPHGRPMSLQDLLRMCPTSTLREQLQNWKKANSIQELTVVQQSAIPFALEYRDVLCIAPTATGKTFSYIFPTMLRLAMDEALGQAQQGGADNPSPSLVAGEEGSTANDAATPAFGRQQVEALLQEKINKGEVCRYCELSIAENPLCPMTGVPHPPLPSDLALNMKPRRAVRLEELASTAEPRVLILVPTSQLAFQVYKVCKMFHADYNIRYMVRASSAEEQKRFLQALEGTDVLISTPETILPAMYKRKLSLKRVRTLILDEIDDLVSVNHFEKLKIILGALPKAAERPQRLLFGASLPPVAYNMIKERMLLPSHRFVLADIKTDHLGHPVRTGARSSHVITQSSDEGAVLGETEGLASTSGVLTGSANGGLTHIVFMVGRIEKLSKLAWLYETGRLTFDQRTLIFCNSRNNVAFVHDRLRTLVPQITITTLTSRASVTAREGVLRMFSSGVSTCLVCTDLLSRGIDFKGVVYVVHFDMPLEMETWVHRNGRCGRNGLPGYVYTFFQPENIKVAKPLVAYLRQHRQLVPPKLQEYAKQSFVELFRKSNFNHPTRPYRRDDPQNTVPVLGRGTPRFPDYRQEGVQKHFRPL